jgi:DNA invertase Pin-like site-specific DNA recombinase
VNKAGGMIRHLTLDELMAAGVTLPAISYARVSSEKQLAGEGLRRQRRGNLDWIAGHPEYRIRLDEESSDAARSAWKGDHVFKQDAALGKLLNMVEQGDLRPPLMIIVEALDRLSREDPWTAHHRLSGLISRGIIVATTKDDRIYDRSDKRALENLLMSVMLLKAAHDESETKSSRVRDAKAMHAIEAQSTKHVIHQNVPGWLYVAEAITNANRTTRRCVRIERHVETVKTMYEMALDHGAAYITTWLIKHREPFGRSGRWNIRYVKLILKSRAPLGHLDSKHGLIEDIFPRIIDDDLWLRVQAASKARTGKGGHKLGNAVNLLAGIGRCAECNGNVRINPHGRTGHRYYECTAHAVLKTCANRSRYRVDIIEHALLNDLGWLKVGDQRRPPIDLSALEEDHAKLNGRYKRLAAKLQELDDDEMYDEIETQLRELRSKRADAAARLNVALQSSAVSAAPVEIATLADRPKLHTALRQLIKGAYFGERHEVAILSKAGLLLMVTARQGATASYLMMLRSDGQMAIADGDGKLRITEASTDLIAAGMTSLDAKTIDDVLSRLGQI